jgi:hypothetical protein
MAAASLSKLSIVLPLALTGLGADEYRPAPKFTGKSIPDPPRQKDPWTPPQTKLPRFLVSATAALFEQGVADPRGCEYREVEVGDSAIIKTRGFILPEQPGQAGRFVVTWDGVVYPALSVGGAADVDKDVRTLAESMRRASQQAAASGGPDPIGVNGGFTGPHSRGGPYPFAGRPSGPEGRSALKLCLLLRLDRADLAEEMFAAGTTWTPEVRGRDLTDYHINYLTLAQDWVTTVFIRLVDVHMRADDAIALDAARRLSAFVKAADAKAEAMGFTRNRNQYGGDSPSYFGFLNQLPELLADHERRAREPARGPIPRRGGDPTARIAAQIRELDQIDEQQMSSPGMAHPGSSFLVRELIAEGDPAVEPLLAAFESDTRLTRSVSYGRGMSIYRFVHPVYEAEFTALTGIFKTSQFNDARMNLPRSGLPARKELARSMRAFWEKNRTISLNERWYRMLRDDSAGQDRWSEAVMGLVQPKDSAGSNRAVMGVGAFRMARPDVLPMAGEELRSRRDPSVSELIARRIAQIARSATGRSVPDRDLGLASSMATAFDRWDEQAARPVIRELMTRCLDVIDRNRSMNSGVNLDGGASGYLSAFTLIRAESGDLAALDEYAAWARKSRPAEMEYRAVECLRPLWKFPKHPAILEAARWLFNDPQSPWVPLLRDPGKDASLLFQQRGLFASPLLRSPGFREGLLAGMGIKSAMGTVRRDGPRTLRYRTSAGWEESFQCNLNDVDSIEREPGRPFRVCDYVAWKLSEVEGSPRCELYWPEDRRDRALAASAAFLKRYGERFTGDAPEGSHDFPERRAHLAFPALGRPASLEDIREARAIFSLEGEGEVRTVPIPSVPTKARWTILKDTPVEYQRSDRTTFREFDQDGWIWQSEEVRKGDRWERYFGFVGHHVIERVPAAEIELARDRFQWGPLAAGLDTRIEPVEPRRHAFEPAEPISVVLRIRNRRGVENATPTEFVRRGQDGRPSLRRGVNLAVFYSAPSPTGSRSRQGVPTEELEPKRADHFEPGPSSRRLGPFEVFDAMQLDLSERFDLARPGSYRVHVAFAADAGLGEGTSNDLYVSVGEIGGPTP